MTRLVWLGALVGIAAIALLVALRGVAAASDERSCTRVDGFVSFCLSVPTGGVRHETTVPLVTLPTARADVRVETTVPGTEVVSLALDADRAVERVEATFARTFSTRPRVLVFGSAVSFARGASELFGYSADTAGYVSSAYGGIFDRSTLTIALNWSSASRDRMNAAVAHELTHLMISEITEGKDIPVWLDEGIATVVEQTMPGGDAWRGDDELTGRALASSGAVALSRLVTVAEFHAAYDRFGRPLYALSADAVRSIVSRIGWAGVNTLLSSVGSGDSFDAAYTAVAGESSSALAARVGATRPSIAVGPVDVHGNVTYSVATTMAHTAVLVTITGERAYAVSFTAMTDALGVYRATFGSTATPGSYTIAAAGVTAAFSTAR